MERITNPSLAELSTDDLNQRYRNTYIEYDGKPVIVERFHAGAIMFQADDGMKQETFDWRKLNVARPESRWYLEPSPKQGQGPYPFHLSYLNSRQWSRGISSGNTVIRSPLGHKKDMWRAFKTVIEHKDTFLKSVTQDVLLGSKLKTDVLCHLLNPNVLLLQLRPADTAWLYLRTRPVAYFDWADNKKTLTVRDECFKQELKDYVHQDLLKEYQIKVVPVFAMPGSQQKKEITLEQAIAAGRISDEWVNTATTNNHMRFRWTPAEPPNAVHGEPPIISDGTPWSYPVHMPLRPSDRFLTTHEEHIRQGYITALTERYRRAEWPRTDALMIATRTIDTHIRSRYRNGRPIEPGFLNLDSFAIPRAAAPI